VALFSFFEQILRLRWESASLSDRAVDPNMIAIAIIYVFVSTFDQSSISTILVRSRHSIAIVINSINSIPHAVSRLDGLVSTNSCQDKLYTLCTDTATSKSSAVEVSCWLDKILPHWSSAIGSPALALDCRYWMDGLEKITTTKFLGRGQEASNTVSVPIVQIHRSFDTSTIVIHSRHSLLPCYPTQ